MPFLQPQHEDVKYSVNFKNKPSNTSSIVNVAVTKTSTLAAYRMKSLLLTFEGVTILVAKGGVSKGVGQQFTLHLSQKGRETKAGAQLVISYLFALDPSPWSGLPIPNVSFFHLSQITQKPSHRHS